MQALLVLVAVLLVAGCGDRLRLAHRINLSVSLPALRAVSEIEDALDRDLLERLGGSLPETWPDDVPPVSLLVPIDVLLLIDRPDLDQVGEDLSRVSEDDFEMRLRHLDWTLDQSALNHPIVDVEIWVGPEGALRPGDAGTALVGHLDGIEQGHGELLFAPGGRRALADQLLEDRLGLLVRALLHFDAAEQPSRPRKAASMSLAIHVDVLK